MKRIDPEKRLFFFRGLFASRGEISLNVCVKRKEDQRKDSALLSSLSLSLWCNIFSSFLLKPAPNKQAALGEGGHQEAKDDIMIRIILDFFH